MTLALTPRSAASLKVTRRLARRLLENAVGEGDERLFEAFKSFLALRKIHDTEAKTSLTELQDHHQSSRPEPYFLESLQAEFDRTDRKRRGMYYTPGPVVDWIIRRIDEVLPPGPLKIVDPACGGGVFLLAAADLAKRRPGSTLVGYDVSEAAVAITRELLAASGIAHQVQQLNPLLVGNELQADLLKVGSSSTTVPTLVILGNPPYANYGRLNRGPWIDALLADYRHGIQERKLNLTDDFIKFLRWGQHWIDRAGSGVLTMITSRTYLTGITHRGMRRSLLESFDQIDIVDLHGDEQSGDENVFPIRRGVAIGVFHRSGIRKNSDSRLSYTSLHGSRADKLVALGSDLPDDCPLQPSSPHWLFIPSATRPAPAHSDYHAWPRLDELFTQFVSGVQTKNDALFVGFDRPVLTERMQRHLDGSEIAFDPACLRPYYVAPFDRRWIYYYRRLLGRARWPLLRSLASDEPNLALVFMRQSTSPGTYDHALVVDSLASDRVFYSRRGAPFLAPLWRLGNHAERLSNLAMNEWVSGGRFADREIASALDESFFRYVYAVLHAPSYRAAHFAELQTDFPRIPRPSSDEAFRTLAALGEQLIDLHLLRCAPPPLLELAGTDPTIARGYPRASGEQVWINPNTSLSLPSPAAWSFHVGGYRVLHRWLASRRGRQLCHDDLQHLAQLCAVAEETARIAAAIDVCLCRRIYGHVE
jgi:predicted helicase